jgi:hypothetical protein
VGLRYRPAAGGALGRWSRRWTPLRRPPGLYRACAGWTVLPGLVVVDLSFRQDRGHGVARGQSRSWWATSTAGRDTPRVPAG